MKKGTSIVRSVLVGCCLSLSLLVCGKAIASDEDEISLFNWEGKPIAYIASTKTTQFIFGPGNRSPIYIGFQTISTYTDLMVVT